MVWPQGEKMFLILQRLEDPGKGQAWQHGESTFLDARGRKNVMRTMRKKRNGMHQPTHPCQVDCPKVNALVVLRHIKCWNVLFHNR